jgi:hypothetical protein
MVAVVGGEVDEYEKRDLLPLSRSSPRVPKP